MAKSPTDTKDQANQIRDAWQNMGNTEVYGGVTFTELATAITSFEAVETTLRSLEDQLTSARNSRDASRLALWTLVKRTRAGAKAQKGDDSDEYERFGGTRLSEIKRGGSSSTTETGG